MALIYGDESPREVERIRKLTYNLVNEYKSHDAKETHSSFNTSDTGMDVDDFGDSLGGYDLFVSSTSNVDTYKFELDSYLEENWKTNGLKYPTLQQVVRDVLVIHVSIVASESTFSTVGRHVISHRNRLHLNLLEALVCVLGTHSNREKHLVKCEVVKDDDSISLFLSFCFLFCGNPLSHIIFILMI
uniref:HAT C-terminal dimerisation domain-containing protein n=1 Tax=Lactuca sativa TaxID=4236 RepID=A0A9R1WKY9_LACSA|nr:hypothetical protein LSAT_V11C200084620 [Lactuca sativa]